VYRPPENHLHDSVQKKASDDRMGFIRGEKEQGQTLTLKEQLIIIIIF